MKERNRQRRANTLVELTEALEENRLIQQKRARLDAEAAKREAEADAKLLADL